MVILLFEQFKTGTNWKLFTREEKNLLLSLSNSNNFLFKKSLAAQCEKWVTDFKPQMQLLLFSQKFRRFVFWNMGEEAKDICWLCNLVSLLRLEKNVKILSSLQYHFSHLLAVTCLQRDQ